jgi:hypothetical protein
MSADNVAVAQERNEFDRLFPEPVAPAQAPAPAAAPRVIVVDLLALARRNEAARARRMGEIPFQRSDGGRREAGMAETRDCTVRAVAIAMCMSYPAAHAKLAALGRKPRRGWPFSPWNAERLGLEHRVNLKEERTVKSLMPRLAKGRFIVRIAGHVFAVVDGRIIDNVTIKPLSRIRNVYEVPGFRQVGA